MSLRILSLAAILVLSSSAFGQPPCSNGRCPVPQSAPRVASQPVFGGRIAGAFMSGEMAPRSHPVRAFLAERRPIRNLFVRR